MPADGGETTQVLPRASLWNDASFAVKARGIYAVGVVSSEAYPIVFFPFDGGKPRTLITLKSGPAMFPEVSPEGRWLLYTAHDDETREIMLVENFR